MSFHESDISWQVLRRIVQDWAGASAELEQVQPLQGGMINTTLCLTLIDGQRAVLKISPHRVNRDYELEAHQLDLLRSLGVPAPRIYQLKIGSLEDPHSFLLMEFIDGVNLHEARRRCTSEQFDQLQEHLAEIVALMHSHTSPVYCRVMPQQSQSYQSWPDFYRHVYDPIVQEAAANEDLPVKARRQIVKIHQNLDRLISHGDVPRLVHWDIWATNLLAGPDDNGRWRIRAVLDPNCKYAHAEAEIAYMELFHTSTPAFVRAYQKRFRLDEGYHRQRKQIYQLYPLISHVNLFGRDYVRPLLEALEKAEKK